MAKWVIVLVCACTGELFFIGYQIDKQPAGVHYAGLDKDGKLQFDVRVDLQEGVMMHDMAITQASCTFVISYRHI